MIELPLFIFSIIHLSYVSGVNPRLDPGLPFSSSSSFINCSICLPPLDGGRRARDLRPLLVVGRSTASIYI